MMRQNDSAHRPVAPRGTGWKRASRHHAPGAGRATRSGFDYLIVGAGFAGSVLAERLATGAGKRVLLIDRRPHIGGKAYDEDDRHGILVHRYGPHIFHTNSSEIATYLSRFTEWRPYEHRVLAQVDGQLVPIPINLTTINKLYGLNLTSDRVEDWLPHRAEPVPVVRTSEDVVVGRVGRELYEKFFRGYTRKQWGVDPSELDKSVTARVPTRTDTDDRYFGDSFQNMPRHGYTRMFEKMLDHPNIKIMLNTDYREIRDEVWHDRLVFTGPIDEFFDFRHGKLPYRSLRFRHETLDREWLQSVAVVNYPSPEVPYTRVTEYKHLTGQQHLKTSVTYEFPAAEGAPYSPVPRPENAELYKKYQALADATPGVHFVGRLATYRYYNMDQVVGQALALHARLCEEERRGGRGPRPAPGRPPSTPACARRNGGSPRPAARRRPSRARAGERRQGGPGRARPRPVRRLLHGRLRVLDAAPARRPAARPPGLDRPRPPRGPGLPAGGGAGPADRARRPALAPDRGPAARPRLVELPADAAGGEGGRRRGRLGPVPLRLARRRRHLDARLRRPLRRLRGRGGARRP